MEHSSIYLVCLLAAVLCGCGLYAYLAIKANHKAGGVVLTLVLAVVCGVLCARLFYFVAHTELLFPRFIWSKIFSLNIKGLTFGGALIGLPLAGVISAKWLQKPMHQTLDLLTPAGLLTLFLARLAEYFVDFGQGSYVENPRLQFFPLSVVNSWDEWYFAVFMLEALFALATLFYVLIKRKDAPGTTWQIGLVLILSSQILCESFRSETLRWGFVRVYQMLSVVGLAALLFSYLWLAKRGGQKLMRLLYLPGLYILGIAILVGVEFALDKWQEMPRLLLYAVMIVTIAMMILLVFKAGRLSKSTAHRASDAQ